ncbi:uncharacterized protein LOC112603549 [Melanaphis sacchari]|uniref:CGG triplet repeat-binding protein 1 n=1 Tax=Melanaphis sacchari TaxID=742174 RepID=A0A2H8TUN8_9HEMI|nr:uncharacterized protein LOC112596891 [Melanaphis sacchari]XP_025207956.1 uncharacterized protein LOC112603549 [Melanaphis sacchari]
MPKVKQNLSYRLQTYVNLYGPNIFSIDKSVLFCKICEIKVNSDKKFNVSQHIKSDKHIKGLARYEYQINRKQQQLLTATSNISKKSSFNKDLCEAFISANIPLNKLENPKFKTFLEVYTKNDIPSESTLRKGYVDDIYNETMDKIRKIISDKKIWVSIDETTDVQGRYIANVIVGTLEENNAGNIFLLNSEELEKANHSTISKLFDRSMSILWPTGIQHDNVLLFLSDAAPYMVKSGEALKSLYSKMIHVTCVVHGLHRVAEEVRSQFHVVDKVISSVKKIFRKAPSRLLVFKSEAPNLPLPPEPIITRWGSWINAAIYYCENFEIIHRVIFMLDRNDAVSIKDAQDNIIKPGLKNNLTYIKSNFAKLILAIEQLQQQHIPLSDSLKIVQDIQKSFETLSGSSGKSVQNKFNQVQEKNRGLSALVKISQVLTGEETFRNLDGLPEDLNCNDLTFFKYAPLTSVDVERSFSAYKTLLSNNRRSFKFENIRKHLIIQCNF